MAAIPPAMSSTFRTGVAMPGEARALARDRREIGGALCLLTAGLLAAAIFVALRRPAQATIARPGAAPLRIVLLLLVSVALRSFLGGCISGAWSGTSTALLIALAAVCGKTAGGLIADGVGWRATAVTALILAAPLVVSASEHQLPAVASSLLVQVTMAATLVAVHLAMPARPGMAFGFPSLSILLGALPDLAGRASLWRSDALCPQGGRSSPRHPDRRTVDRSSGDSRRR
jgi:hypothetical protein